MHVDALNVQSVAFSPSTLLTLASTFTNGRADAEKQADGAPLTVSPCFQTQ
jgi:hypothetical protein